MIDTRAVGAYISQLRRDADLTQAEMANKLNVTHQAVSKWENGLALPDIQTLLDLADLFGVSIEQILRGGNRVPTSRTGVVSLGGSEVSQQQVQDRPSSEPPSRTPEYKPVHGETTAGAPMTDMEEPLGAPAPTVGMKVAQGTPTSTADPAGRLGAEAEQGERIELDLHLLSELAPFMSRETVDRIFEMACVGEADPDCLVELAPFVSRDKLEKAVDLISEGKLSIGHLEGLAPFLGRQALRRTLSKIEDGSLDRKALVALAPFLGSDLVEAFVFGKVKKD